MTRPDPDDEFDPEHESGAGSASNAGSEIPPFSFASHARHPGCCPQCSSAQIEQRHLARRTAAVLGVLAGATSGIVRTLQATEVLSTGARIGLAIGLRTTAGPMVGLAATALAAALLEGAAGCALGVRLGDAIDRMILPTYRCRSCDHCFSATIDEMP